MNYKTLILSLFIFTINLSSEDVLNETVYWELTRVDAKIEEKKFDEAEKILNRWYKKTWRSRSYNKAVIARTFGFFLYQQERYDEALEKLQVAYDDKALPLAESTTLVKPFPHFYPQKSKQLKLKNFL